MYVCMYVDHNSREGRMEGRHQTMRDSIPTIPRSRSYLGKDDDACSLPTYYLPTYIHTYIHTYLPAHIHMQRDDDDDDYVYVPTYLPTYRQFGQLKDRDMPFHERMMRWKKEKEKGMKKMYVGR